MNKTYQLCGQFLYVIHMHLLAQSFIQFYSDNIIYTSMVIEFTAIDYILYIYYKRKLKKGISTDLYHKFNGFDMNLVFSALHLFLNSFILKYLEETEYVMKSLRLEFEGYNYSDFFCVQS